MEELERWYLFDGANEEMLKIIPLVRNGKFLLWGPYGFGKSFYAYLVARIFFGYSRDEVPMVQLNNELTVNDVFFSIDVASLMNGEEKVEPRSIVTAPFKFVNEFQRGNHRVYNTFLGLFEEGFIAYRDRKFRTRDYIAILDANPFDSGSVEVPSALMDRITASVYMRSLPGDKMLEMMERDLDSDRVRTVMKERDMRRVWGEVEKVRVPDSSRLLMVLLHGYFSNCVYGDKAAMDHRHVATLCESCRYRTEPCYMVREPLGHRWWRDVTAIARARAYFHGRGEVNSEDVFFAAKYALQHRIRTREKLRSLYRSREAWVDEMLDNARIRLKKVWIPAIKGSEKAWKMDERTLRILGDAP